MLLVLDISTLIDYYVKGINFSPAEDKANEQHTRNLRFDGF